TYRVFDWNRSGLDGKPRALHVRESLASINFQDFDPPLIRNRFTQSRAITVRPLVEGPYFTVEAYELAAAGKLPLPADRMQIIAVLAGTLQVSHDQTSLSLTAGQFALVPACLKQITLRSETS